MKVSVITVCFNSKKTIADTLYSVHEQSHKDIEHIVVDGASNDGTLEVIGRTPIHLARLVSEPDKGIYDAMNKGISIATGDIVGFLNSDDVYADERSLENIVDAFDNPNIDACYGDVLFVAANNFERVVRYWKAGPYSPGSLAKGWMPPHPTFYVRRHVYERAGGFDPAYHLQADFEMAIRLIELQKIRMRYIPNTLVRMRMGGASNASISNIVRGNMEAYHAIRKHHLPVSPLFPLRKILSRIPQFFSRPDHRSQG